VPHRKRVVKRKRRKQVRPGLGAAGVVSLLLGGIASVEASGSPADMPPRDLASPPEITLSEEEISDVRLTTFHTFDKENDGTPRRLEKTARCYRCTTRVTCRCRYKGRTHG
jgi:hypothetical protein